MKSSSKFISRWNHLPEAWRWPFAVWVVITLLLWGWWLLLFNIGMISPESLPEGETGWLYAWDRSDTVYYLDIAEDGYETPKESLFYPLFPLLGRGLHFLTGLPLLPALLLISHLCALGCLLLLYRLAREWGGPILARRAVLAAAIFPTGYYFWNAYPQSLLLLCVLLAHYLARRGRWLAACLAALAAGAAHSTAIIAALPLLVLGYQAAVKARQGFLRWALLLPAGFPLLGMGLFQAWRLHAGFESFGAVQYTYFQRVIYWPWQTLGLAVQQAFSPDVVQMMPRVNLFFLVFLILAWVWSLRRLPLEYNTYLLAGLGLGLTASSQVEALWSFARFILVMFPIFIVLSAWMKTRLPRLLLTTLLLAGWFLLSAIFLAGAWVA